MAKRKRAVSSRPRRGPSVEQLASVVDINLVAGTLYASMRAHNEAHAARRRGDKATALRELTDAWRLRVEAQRLDPEHVAPVWQREADDLKTPDIHEQLMAFYRQQLAS